GGAIGFVTADTFFTLESFGAMRELLQSHRLEWLGQCVPFDATVDAAIFVTRNESTTEDVRLTFVQARPLKRVDGSKTTPEKKLQLLPDANNIEWNEPPTELVQHATMEELRVHDVPRSLYISAHKRAFVEPRPGTLALYTRFNDSVKQVVDEWWPRIEDSRAFAANLGAIQSYHRRLRPGHITLVGLIAEGGQGMRTANNARFLAYLEGTDQARDILVERERWTKQWLANPKIGPVFRALLQQHGGNPAHPTAKSAAWEACI